MKRRAVALRISDHAVLRFIERGLGVDVWRIRQHLAGKAMNAAELSAVVISFDGVRLMLEDNGEGCDGRRQISVTTALEPHMKATRNRGKTPHPALPRHHCEPRVSPALRAPQGEKEG